MGLPLVGDLSEEEEAPTEFSKAVGKDESTASVDATAVGPLPPTKEVADRLEQQTFERHMLCQVFRDATSAKELELAITKAMQLGLVHEATLGKRKLEKLLADQ